MLEPQPRIIENLVRGYSNILLYGGKSSGKTKLVRETFENTKRKFIYINCILTDDRASFLRLFMFQFKKFLKKFDESFLKQFSMEESERSVNLDGWLKQMKKIGELYPEKLQNLGRIYIFMDKIEQLIVSESFLSNFYKICTSELKYFKFSFFLVGVTTENKIYTLEHPLRSIITFCMKKPDIEEFVDEKVDEAIKQIWEKNLEDKEIRKLRSALKTSIYHRFETIQTNLQQLRKIIRLLVKTSSEYCKNDVKKINLWIGSQIFKDAVKQIAQYGPLSEEDIRIAKEIQEKKEEGVTNFYEYYPNLLLSSLYLAEAVGESEDKRRFVDYKKSSKRLQKRERKREKALRNPMQRIIAISEVLESQGKGKKEKDLDHHSLDFYGCIEYLISEGKLNYSGNTIKSYGGKVTGKAKEEQFKYFMKEIIDLNYHQFM